MPKKNPKYSKKKCTNCGHKLIKHANYCHVCGQVKK